MKRFTFLPALLIALAATGQEIARPVMTLEIAYSGGVRYAHLERIAGTRDYLSEILQPRSVKP